MVLFWQYFKQFSAILFLTIWNPDQISEKSSIKESIEMVDILNIWPENRTIQL
jgi:hypothetical protein